jgi:hypothetical protein
MTTVDMNLALQKALDYVEQHPLHDLSLGHRFILYALLGPRADLPDSSDLTGYQRRSMLQLLSIQPIITLLEGDKDFILDITRLIASAEDVIYGRVERDEAIRQTQTVRDELVALPAQRPLPQLERGVIEAVLHMYGIALYDLTWKPHRLDPNLSDEDEEAEIEGYRDVAGLAAALVAGGHVWDENSDPQKRRAYWTWWLREAVVAAYNRF